MLSSLALEDWLAALAALAIPLVLLVAVWALRAIGRAQRRRQQRAGRLELTNLGNVRSCYDLAVEEPSGALEFHFAHDGAALPSRFVAAGPTTAHAPAPAPHQPTAGQAVGQGLRLGSAIEDVLTSIGQLLPRPLGTPLLNLSSGLRDAGYTVKGVQDARERVASAAQDAASVTSGKEATAPSLNGKHPPNEPAHRESPDAAYRWARTPYMAPGETVTIEMLIMPTRRVAAQPYAFRILSRAADQPGEPVAAEPGRFELRPLPWFWRALPAVPIAGALVSVAGCAAYLAFSFGLFG